jgi:hypothetical protein
MHTLSKSLEKSLKYSKNQNGPKATALNNSTGELLNARISMTNSRALLSISKKISDPFKQITTQTI